jgi:para-aminobenzoate synthetase component 1
MRPIIQEISTAHTPESLVDELSGERGLVLLRSTLFDSPQARYSFVAARPFLTFRSFGSRCEVGTASGLQVLFGNPWRLLESFMARFELLDQLDLPFPLGGCFGYWGYDLKNFVEPKLTRRADNDLELPDCSVGFYASLVVFDHALAKVWLIVTGLEADGSRTRARAQEQLEFWSARLSSGTRYSVGQTSGLPVSGTSGPALARNTNAGADVYPTPAIASNLSREEFLNRVERVLAYIHAGDIYQVNLAQRLAAPLTSTGWAFFQRLSEVSPAPFSAFIDCGEFQLASTSPELFVRLSGAHILTRPIKGTRPRAADPTRDAQLAYELQTSTKELSELVMITDLLRNDLGKVCEFGSVHVPELARLERYPQVQHMVSTIEGRLAPGATHFAALAACFPGGSITGAPKFRAMEIIDELEPTTRGPYTGALGYLGFNRESQLSIIIRAALCTEGTAYFSVGAGIVADSVPSAEYEETLAKAGGFFAALQPDSTHARFPQRPVGA